MGTEPIRRAADSARLVVELEAASGVPLHVLTHEEEAYLTLVGVTAGLPVAHETLVVDIGGGSSEFCAVGAGGRARAAGLRLGSNRLTMKFVRRRPADPRSDRGDDGRCRQLLRTALPAAPTDIVLVGGTASNLLKVTAAGVADRVITRERVAEAVAILAASDAAAAPQRASGQSRPERGLLPAGAVIVDALMRRYGVDARPRLGSGHARGGDPGRRARRSARGEIGSPNSPTGGAAGQGRRVRGRRRPARATAGTHTGDPAPGRPDRATQSRDLLLAVDQVAADRRALERSGSPACSTRKVRAIEAVTSASFIRPRWSWRAVTRAISGAASAPSASRTNSSE